MLNKIRLKGLSLNIAVCIASLLITFITLEIAARIYKGEYRFISFLEEARELYTQERLLYNCCPFQYDPFIGWVPQDGYIRKDEEMHKVITTTKYGIRSNGHNEIPLSSPRPILALGDSFTWGYYVSDHETWPALLERLLGEKVINAGVFGYGVDQMYLRAENLIKIFNPKTIILSFLAADVVRTEHSIIHGVGKPYFEVIDKELVIKNVPVPEPKRVHNLDPFRKVAGYSYLIHKVMMRNNKEFWIKRRVKWKKWKKEQYEGEKITCMLIDKLQAIARANDVKKVYILIQYASLGENELKMMDGVLGCLNTLPVDIVDVRPALSRVKNDDQTTFEGLFTGKGGRGHPTSKGYSLVADQMFKAIKADL